MTNEVLDYLTAFISENGYAPTVRDIQLRFGWKSPDTTQRRLQALVDDGLIVRVSRALYESSTMPKSKAADLALLREEVFERDEYRCKWPGCTRWVLAPHYAVDFLQLAHLTHRGMGGSKERNTASNCVTLCTVHHDCLDGRTGLGILRTELNVMLRAQI